MNNSVLGWMIAGLALGLSIGLIILADEQNAAAGLVEKCLALGGRWGETGYGTVGDLMKGPRCFIGDREVRL